MAAATFRPRLAALSLALLLALPAARAEEGSSILMPPPDPNQPSLLELLQRVFTPSEDGGLDAANPWTTPRGVVIQPHPVQKVTPAEEEAAAAPPPALPEAAAGEETVAQPLREPDFKEQPLAPLPVPAAIAPGSVPTASVAVPEAAAPAAAEAAPEADAQATSAAPVAAAPAVPRFRPERQGYAFGHPRILAQQTLFGLSHGISLLARACSLLPEEGELAREAYGAWEAKNRVRIEQAEYELARYYFTPPAEEVRRLDLIQALQLKSDLGLSTDGPELKAACATLPEALAKPRYDLEAQWLLKGDVERLRRATETRELVSQCRQQTDPDAVERLDAALAAWEQANAASEAEARQRLVADMATLPDPKQPDQPADGEALMKTWQDELRRGVGRRLAYGAAEACPGLADALPGKAHALNHAFDAE
ncbi:MAG: hypothetical protein ACOZCK_06510 [Pseudomonadota bacterium]